LIVIESASATTGTRLAAIHDMSAAGDNRKSRVFHECFVAYRPNYRPTPIVISYALHGCLT